MNGWCLILDSSATISIITPTWKGICRETEDYVRSCPYVYEWLQKRGVDGAPAARNKLLDMAQYEYVMNLDEDCWLDSWDGVLPSHGAFKMDTYKKTQPQGRCAVFLKEDLLNADGYDVSLRYSVDDVDLCCRLLDMGLRWERFSVTHHRDHVRHFNRKTALNECKVVMRHHKKHPEFTRYILEYQWTQFHPLKWVIQFIGYGYYGISRSL